MKLERMYQLSHWKSYDTYYDNKKTHGVLYNTNINPVSNIDNFNRFPQRREIPVLVLGPFLPSARPRHSWELVCVLWVGLWDEDETNGSSQSFVNSCRGRSGVLLLNLGLQNYIPLINAESLIRGQKPK